ncbi:MAG: NPCBM/NEW2 domain-containing protein [Spirochaetes bacterium]|nr:NPCBM/NEW2 domain-containing protein [Spirochaetota bacterium]
MNPRNILILSLGIFLPLFGTEAVRLGEVPPTDAADFWTQDGPRPMVVDKNLQGHAIAIAGVTYARGISGHTGFSVVYNLSGLACGFTALAGIEDEDHPKDPKDGGGADLNVVVLVDRKEVFRRNVRLGEKAIPLAIPLVGAHQIELRGEYGKSGFLRQRIAYADPLLEVSNRDGFLRQAAAWRERVAAGRQGMAGSAEVPPWKKIRIEKIAEGSNRGQFQVATSNLTLRFAPDIGGMILAFGPPGGPNAIHDDFKAPQNVPNRGACPDFGAHFNRFQPRNYFLPADPILLCGRYRVEFPAEGEIILSSPESAYLFLVQRYEIHLDPARPGLRVVNIQKNTAPFPQACGIWSITRVPPKAAREIAVPREAEGDTRKSALSPETHRDLIRRDGGWDRLDTAAALARTGAKGLEWQQQPAVNEIQVRYEGFRFRLQPRLLPGDLDLMGDFYPAHFYVCPKFIEVESHGPTKILPPNGEIALEENWELIPD